MSSSSCIHGFPEAQCASCRQCPHGLTSSRCGRCAEVASTPRRVTAKSAIAEAASAPGPEERSGFQIFYVPELSGWQYRDPDDRTSPVSYRSLFLARKAVDKAAGPSSDTTA